RPEPPDTPARTTSKPRQTGCSSDSSASRTIANSCLSPAEDPRLLLQSRQKFQCDWLRCCPRGDVFHKFRSLAHPDGPLPLRATNPVLLRMSRLRRYPMSGFATLV